MQGEAQQFSDLLSENDSSKSYPQRDAAFNSKCRDLLESMFVLQGESPSSLSIPLGPLSQIHTSSQFAHDQLWQQLELRNKAILPFLKDYVSSATSKRRRVSFTEPPLQNGDAVSPDAPDNSFNIDDIETLVARKSSTKALRNKSSDAPLDESDLEDTDLYEDSDEGEDGKTDANGDGPLYSDFFDQPPPSQMEIDNIIDADNDSGLASPVGDDDSGDDDDDADSADSAGDPTPLQKLRDSQNEKIAAIEEGNIRPKPWSLRGEVSASARPKDSLLETSLEHDTTVRPKSFVSTQISERIESVIKQRIVDGLFDDVIVALPEHYQASKKRKDVDDLPHISQEKPTEGLAELYAREFTDKQAEDRKRADASVAVQRVNQEVENDAQKEVNMLLSKLCSRLDALASVNIINEPQEKSEETMVTKHNVKSIVAEEAVPDAVSDGDMLAPHEVFSVKKSESKGSAEMNKEERRAKRQRNKNRGAAQRKAQAALDRSKEYFDPVTVDKRKGERIVGRDRIRKVKFYS